MDLATPTMVMLALTDEFSISLVMRYGSNRSGEILWGFHKDLACCLKAIALTPNIR